MTVFNCYDANADQRKIDRYFHFAIIIFFLIMGSLAYYASQEIKRDFDTKNSFYQDCLNHGVPAYECYSKIIDR